MKCLLAITLLAVLVAYCNATTVVAASASANVAASSVAGSNATTAEPTTEPATTPTPTASGVIALPSVLVMSVAFLLALK